MEQCIHSSEVNINNTIVCRKCGQTVSERVEASGLQSASLARRILDTIAVECEYQAVGFEDGFVVYGKGDMEVTIVKKTKRRFDIIRRNRLVFNI